MMVKALLAEGRMSTGQAGSILRYIHDVVATGTTPHLSDAEALRCFAAQRDERAFALLLERHSRSVWAVCRHLLHHEQDAEDAFQATFLLLAQRAGSIRQAGSVGSFLHGVAYRVAIRVKQANRRRHAREREAQSRQGNAPAPDTAWLELQAALDEEVARLPEKYRAPFVLCCLGCRTRAEAARELGCREGTVSSRIARARDLLRVRLARRGVTLSAALCAGVLWQHSSRAAVPAALVQATLAAGTSGAEVSAGVRVLAEGVLRSPGAGRWALVVALLVGFGLLAATAVAPPPRPRPSAAAFPVPAARARTDLFGDPLPPGALARMGTVRFAHGESRYGYPVLAPDHATFATVSNATYPGQGMVCLWDAVTGKEVHRLHDPDFVYHEAFFLHGEKLLGTMGVSRKPVQGGKDAHVLHFWDPSTGKKAAREIRVVGSRLHPWALSGDEKHLVSANWEPPVVIRDLQTGMVLARWPGAGVRIDHLAFSPDGKTVGICCGGSVHLWDWKTLRAPRRLGPFPEHVQHLWFSPDGKWLAASIYKEGLRVWEATCLTELRRFKGEHDVRFFLDGKRLISLTTGVVRDVESGKQVGRFEGCEYCLTLEFSRDGKTATGYALGRIRRWDAATGKDRSAPPLATNRGMIHQVGFTPDGRAVVSASPNGAVQLWDAATGQPLRTLVQGSGADNWRPTFLRVAADGTVVVARGKRLSFFKGTQAPEEVEVDEVACLCISPDGSRLVLTGGTNANRFVQVWDLPRRKRLVSFRPPERACLESLGVSGRSIAACVDRRVCLLNAQTGQIERMLGNPPPLPPPAPPGVKRRGGHSYSWFHGVHALTFSPGGDLLACAGHPAGAVELLDVLSGKRRHLLVPAADAGRHYQLRNAVFSPCGRMLATESSDGVVDVWETSSGRRRRRFLGHRSYQTTLAFSPDGKRLATGNRDATILVWDMFGLWTGGSAAGEPAVLWERLKDSDAERACEAMGRLMRCPQASVPLLKRHLLARKSPDVVRLRRWIADLDSDEFRKREQASAELARRVVWAEPALKAALAGNPSLEVRLRIGRLLQQAKPAPPRAETLRGLRALEVLEHIGSGEARQVLRQVAEGDFDPWLGAAAKAAVARLAVRGG
jgi:RNA polymerase sigma factor (sigma-70 family)